MPDKNRKVVTVDNSCVSHSAPMTPITKSTKTFLQRTQVIKIKSPELKMGIPIPIKEGSQTPNQQALELLAGFATGNVRMKGHDIQHLPTVTEVKSIDNTLQELSWDSPSPTKKKRTDGSAN